METWSNDLDFQSLGERFGTPLYIFNPQQLQQNFSDYLSVVEHPEHIAYPVKANPSLEVLRQLYKLGSSAECASMTEVNLAQSAGFPTQRIIFNSPAAKVEDTIELWQQGCTVIIDSIDILGKIDEVFSGSPRGKLLVRVNPIIPIEYAHQADWQSVTSHGSSTAKFGIPSESLIGLLKNLMVPVNGLHIHVGTQMDTVQSFVNITQFLHQLTDEIHTQTHHQIQILDLGGGLGIDFKDIDCYPSISDLATALAGVKRKEITYWVEPGQSLVGNTMGLLTQVVALKTIREKRWAIVDVGSDQLIKITLLNWYHQILKADRQPLPFSGNDAVGGPLCFSGDTLLPTTCLDNVQAGDYLLIQHCGAYCYAVSNNFNGRSYGGMVKLNADKTVELCNCSEPEQLNTIYSTYLWQQDYPKWEVAKSINLDIVNSLNSDYLQYQTADDRYEIISMTQSSENCFEYEFAVKSEVSFVSMPFALRLIADATIISVLYWVGKNRKDISVWGDRLVLNCPQQIRSNRVLKCHIALSPVVAVERRRIAIAQFSLDEGKFFGSVRPIFRL